MAAKTIKKDKQTKQKQVISEANRRTLRTWNLRLAGLLAIEAVAIIVIGGAQSVPVTWQYLTTNVLASEASGHQILALATRHLFDVQLSWMVAKFLLIFAATYLLAATIWRAKYEAWLERGANKLRWVAFGLGGGVMAMAVAMLSGVSDVAYLVLIFAALVMAGLSAMAVELLGPERRLQRLLAGMAIFGAVLPWLVFAGSAVAVLMFNGSLPGFVYYTYGSIFLLSVAVGLATYFRNKRQGKWADGFYTERMYMLLGFVAASVLAWQIFAGALQP